MPHYEDYQKRTKTIEALVAINDFYIESECYSPASASEDWLEFYNLTEAREFFELSKPLSLLELRDYLFSNYYEVASLTYTCIVVRSF